MNSSISVAIVEDDKHYNNALRKIIDFQPDLKTAGQFFSGKDALSKIPTTDAQVVLMDIQLPDLLGIELVRELKNQCPGLHFVMCTSFEDDEKIFASLKAGACGYLIKGETLDKMLTSIRDAANGGSPMSFSIAKKVRDYFFNLANPQEVLSTGDLTRKETEVLQLISEGFLYKEIADQKCISLETVKKHVANIYKKLHVNNKIEAINKFQQNKP